jgi:hypothetical protein
MEVDTQKSVKSYLSVSVSVSVSVIECGIEEQDDWRRRMWIFHLRDDSSDVRTFDLPTKSDALVLNMLPIRYLLQINKLGSKSDHLGCARQILP